MQLEGIAVTLVGTSSVQHLRENLEVLALPPLTSEEMAEIFERRHSPGWAERGDARWDQVSDVPDAELWREVEAIFCPDVLQTDAEDFNYLEVPEEIERWPVVREGEEAWLPTPAGTFVYEGRRSGQGEVVDWAMAAELAKRGRMILAGGLSEDNVAEAIATVHPFGVDVSSGVERAPGIKSRALIMDFVAAVRNSQPACVAGVDR